ERLVLLQGARAAGKHLRSRRQRVAELLREPALADAGLAEEGDEVRARGLRHAVERVGEERELALAVDERDRPAGRPQREAGHRPRADGSLEALRGDVAPRTDLDVLADQVTRRLPEEDLSRLRGLLKPRREVHRGAEHDAPDGRIRDDGDRAGVDADADPERNGQAEPLSELGDALLDVERGPDRPQRVFVA